MKISLIIPVYNAEQYLDECLKSVCNQSYEDFEILLVNDGSTDSSLSICEKYRQNNKNIRVISQQNSGVSQARNTGIKEAQGDYIAFVDADDTVEPNYLNHLIQNMIPGGMVACSIDKVTDNVGVATKLTKSQAQISLFCDKGMRGFPVCKLFDRQIIIKKSVYFQPDISICEDLLFVAQYLSECNKEIVWVNVSDYNYRYNPLSALNKRFIYQKFDDRWLSEYEALERIKTYLLPDAEVLKAWRLRKAKAGVTCLRSIQASSDKNVADYQNMLMDARKNLVQYLVSSQGAVSSRISILLASISPALELFVWRIFQCAKSHEDKS